MNQFTIPSTEIGWYLSGEVRRLYVPAKPCEFWHDFSLTRDKQIPAVIVTWGTDLNTDPHAKIRYTKWRMGRTYPVHTYGKPAQGKLKILNIGTRVDVRTITQEDANDAGHHAETDFLHMWACWRDRDAAWAENPYREDYDVHYGGGSYAKYILPDGNYAWEEDVIEMLNKRSVERYMAWPLDVLAVEL